MSDIILHVAQRGVITLPKALRDAYGIKVGDSLRLLNLDGVFVLTTQPSQVDALADRLAAELRAKGETLETMLRALREERARYND
jgi:bifunctional DNA-binding transcriptional regulator/antitoxin component of YhaV-PrlF toxin-antitoxin module